MRTCTVTAALLLAGASGAVAHDFWLAVSGWSVRPGSNVTITANVGERFPVPDSVTAPERVASLKLIGPDGKVTHVSDFRKDQRSLAADVTLGEVAGTYLALMIVKPRFIEIQPRDFTSYLTHEGLERVIQERGRLGESGKPGRERYSRYAKVVIGAGDGPSDHVTRPLGLAAELVPLTHPTRLRMGESLTLRLLANGRPVADALVGGIYAGSTGAPDEWPLKARTNEQGEARFVLDHPGPWLFRSVHIVRRGGETGAEAVDWESSWASLTFNLRH